MKCSLLTVIIITGMVLAAELSGENEIIFPEIAAIAVGSILAPKLSWNVTPRRMLGFIMLCAVSGMLIVRYLPGPLWLQITGAYLLGQLILGLSGTGFAPMISAIVLPVMLGTENPVYLLSAFLLTAAILTVRYFLEKKGIKEKRAFAAAKLTRDGLIRILYRTAVVLLLSFVFVRNGFRFCLAPPLLVAFTELNTPGCKAAERPVSVVFLVFLCAVTGSLARRLLVMELGVMMAAAAALTAGLLTYYVRRLRLYFPPAGAMAVLAFLIPAGSVQQYPLQVLAGTIVLFVFTKGEQLKMRIDEIKTDKMLRIRTGGRDDSEADTFHYPYEPTPYAVLDRLAGSGYLKKEDRVLDYGAGKGRVDLYLAYAVRCHCTGIELSERLWKKACENAESGVSGNRVSFVHADAGQYQLPPEVNRLYFFNPFSVEILKKVLKQLRISCYEAPREILLFFYYPSDDYVALLMQEDMLEFIDEIDCRDLEKNEDPRERILIFGTVS